MCIAYSNLPIAVYSEACAISTISPPPSICETAYFNKPTLFPMADQAWIQQMAEAEEAAEQQNVTHDDVDTEPALSPRPLEPPQTHVQQEAREIPVMRQPPPPPQAERPDYQHRTTQWLGRQPSSSNQPFGFSADKIQHKYGADFF